MPSDYRVPNDMENWESQGSFKICRKSLGIYKYFHGKVVGGNEKKLKG